MKESVARACILAGLRETIASPVVLGFARKRIAERLGEITRGADGEARGLRANLAKIDARISKLTDAIANGAALDSVLARLAAEENEAKSLRARLVEVESVQRTPIRLPSPDEVLEAVLDLDARLAADVEAGREAIRRLLRGGTIRLRPTPEASTSPRPTCSRSRSSWRRMRKRPPLVRATGVLQPRNCGGALQGFVNAIGANLAVRLASAA